VIVAETEIWPNLFRETKRTGAALAMVNARISDKAFPALPAAGAGFSARCCRRRMPSWRRAERSPGAISRSGAAPAAVRHRQFQVRFRAARAAPKTRRDGACSPAGPEHVWIAASTMPPTAGDADEDAAVIDAYRAVAARGIPACC
jgi:3-deoxy-D-manno-octulosonic-acid transferase